MFKPVNLRGEESPHYSFRTLYKGRRGAFTTGTGNKEAAAKIASGYMTGQTLVVDGGLTITQI